MSDQTTPGAALAALRPTTTLTCQACGASFVGLLNRPGKYCSRRCVNRVEQQKYRNRRRRREAAQAAKQPEQKEAVANQLPPL